MTGLAETIGLMALLMAGAFVAAVVSGSAGFGFALLPLLTRTVGVSSAVRY